MHEPSDVPLASKVAALRRSESFPDSPSSVELIETHFAWVFLGARFAYKLKKPIRFQNIDFTHLQTRKADCELEITLNRRLAEDVYKGIVALTLSSAGLCLEGEGETVEWLVKMHRLPRHRLLDRAAVDGTVTTSELGAVIAKLTNFYAKTPTAAWDGPEYRRHLDAIARKSAVQLAAPEFGLDTQRIERVAAAQCRFIEDNAQLLEARVAEGRVVDAHGDLRPEHIFLAENPQIIDCLEFSTELRWLDTAEEISFLILECQRFGHHALGDHLGELYCRISADPRASELFDFYRSLRAVLRAVLYAWRIHDDASNQPARHWLERANWYLDAAESSVAAAR